MKLGLADPRAYPAEGYQLTTEFDLEEAKKIWREEAFEDGVASGMASGVANERIRLAKRLLEVGVPTEKITEVTELSSKEIEHLWHQK